MTSIKYITILVPLYNEELVISHLIERLDKLIDASVEKNEVLFIDDGSKDNTTSLIEKSIAGKDNYSALFLSRNFGHDQALTAGLLQAADTNADAVFIIDGDLQDPPEMLPFFYKK